jgi:hypothetical protein
MDHAYSTLFNRNAPTALSGIAIIQNNALIVNFLRSLTRMLL